MKIGARQDIVAKKLWNMGSVLFSG